MPEYQRPYALVHASELRDTPLKDLRQLGGWKSPLTVLTWYQQPDQDTMRRSLEARHRKKTFQLKRLQ